MHNQPVPQPTPLPNRSILRRYPAMSISLAIFLALAGWFTYEIIRAVTAKPGRPGLYAKDMENIVRKHQESRTGPDLWPVYVNAVNAIHTSQRAFYDRIGRPSPTGGFPDPPIDWPEGLEWPPDPNSMEREGSNPRRDALIRDLIKQLRDDGALAELAKLQAPGPAVRPAQEIRAIEILLPELGYARQSARINHARMMFAIQDGDTTEFLAALEQSLSLARINAGQWTLIDHLVGYAITALVMHDVRYLLSENRLDTPTLRGIQAAMDRQLPLSPVALALEGERLAAMDTIEWSHSTDGRAMPSAARHLTDFGAGGTIQPPALGGVENLLSIVLPSKQDSQEVLNEFYAIARKHVSVPAHARTHPSQVEQFAENLSSRYVIVKLMIPAIDKALTTSSNINTDIAATRTLLALQLHRLEKSAYPAKLEDLIPTYLQSLPADEFSPNGFTYILNDATGSDPSTAFTLYSFGPDLTDNGGTPPPSNSPNTRNTDPVYNVKRPLSQSTTAK